MILSARYVTGPIELPHLRRSIIGLVSHSRAVCNGHKWRLPLARWSRLPAPGKPIDLLRLAWLTKKSRRPQRSLAQLPANLRWTFLQPIEVAVFFRASNTRSKVRKSGWRNPSSEPLLTSPHKAVLVHAWQRRISHAPRHPLEIRLFQIDAPQSKRRLRNEALESES